MILIYGNNVGAMISALELAKSEEVTIVYPNKFLGGHFSGRKIGAYHFDLGMTFLEFHSNYIQSIKLIDYDPSVHNDSARFFKHVESYLGEFNDFVEIDKILTYVNGSLYDDIVVADNLLQLSQFPERIKAQIEEELLSQNSQITDDIHPSRKRVEQQLFIKHNLKTVSTYCHGNTLHESIIEPLVGKMLNTSSDQLMSLYHRMAWVPLYYPESVLDAIRNKDLKFTPTKFHYTLHNNFGKIVRDLELKIKQSPRIRTHTTEVQKVLRNTSGFQITCEEGTKFDVAKLIWGNSLRSFLNVANFNPGINFTEQTKSSICMAYLVLKCEDVLMHFSTLHVCAGNDLIFRICNQSYCSKMNGESVKISVEMNSDRAQEYNAIDRNSLEREIKNFLIEAGIAKGGVKFLIFEVENYRNAILIPTEKNYNTFNTLKNEITGTYPEVEFIGPGSGFSSNSFNCQVIQGLSLAEKIG